MNILESEIPPQVLVDLDVPSRARVARNQASSITPDSFNLPSHFYGPSSQRMGFGAFQVTRPSALYPPELGLYEQQITRISVRIADAIELSRRILDLSENWDEEGSPAYAEATWDRAAHHVKQTAIEYRKSSGVWVNPPKITPGPDGSIDVRWKTSARSVLINFPAADSEPVQFFGSDRDIESIRGTLDIFSQNLWILMWLMR